MDDTLDVALHSLLMACTTILGLLNGVYVGIANFLFFRLSRPSTSIRLDLDAHSTIVTSLYYFV